MTNRSVHFSIPITFTDVPQFYYIIRELNRVCGNGKHCWTLAGKVLKFLNKGTVVNTTLFVYDGSTAKKSDVDSILVSAKLCSV